LHSRAANDRDLASIGARARAARQTSLAELSDVGQERTVRRLNDSTES